MYPKLLIDINKLRENIDAVAKITKADGGCSMMIVTKCLCADRKVAEMITSHPEVDYLADSRIANIKKYQDLVEASGKQSVLLRLPMMSEIEDVVRYANVSFNSEMETIEALNAEAGRQGKVHKVVLMVDLGDLREGIFFENEEEILETAEKIHAMEHVELYGMGTNLTCYGAIIPKNDNLSVLCAIARMMAASLVSPESLALPQMASKASTRPLSPTWRMTRGWRLELAMARSLPAPRSSASSPAIPGNAGHARTSPLA